MQDDFQYFCRFREAYQVAYDLKIVKDIKSQVLSPQTTYAVYLVYKLPEGKNKFEAPLKVVDRKDLAPDDWNEPDVRYIYLVSPQIPVIVGGKVDENAHIPVNRPNLKGIPQLRNDGWMEVQACEFRTASTEMIPIHFHLPRGVVDFQGLIIQGIEFRPI